MLSANSAQRVIYDNIDTKMIPGFRPICRYACPYWWRFCNGAADVLYMPKHFECLVLAFGQNIHRQKPIDLLCRALIILTSLDSPTKCEYFGTKFNICKAVHM